MFLARGSNYVGPHDGFIISGYKHIHIHIYTHTYIYIYMYMVRGLCSGVKVACSRDGGGHGTWGAHVLP